jgi:hypothetical protein
MSTTLPQPAARSRVDASTVFAGLILLGAAVAVSIGAYAKVHTPSGRPLFTLGFSGMLQMKAWLTTLALALLVVQLLTALWMWGKLPGAGAAPNWGVLLHRWSGAAAFIVTLPVAFHCIWSLGWGVASTRAVVHGELGCAFYGAYAAKMLGLRVPKLPSWGLPILGGLVLGLLVLVWATAALWFFTESGSPLT